MYSDEFYFSNLENPCFTDLINQIKEFEQTANVSYLVMSQYTLNKLLEHFYSKNFIIKKGTKYYTEPQYMFDKYYIAICNELSAGMIHIV